MTAPSKTTTRAATVVEAHVLKVDDVELPPLRPHDVEIEVLACGICGTNLHHLSHPNSIPEPKRSCPGALGHEVVGLVSAVGDGVSRHQVGDAVALEPQLAAACGRCEYCELGAPWFCSTPRALATWGFAERITIDERGAWPLPAGIEPGTATLIEPLAVVVHALRTTAHAAAHGRRIDGVRVAVLGSGVTGLLGVVASRHLGADVVGVSARYEHQAQHAARLGAQEVVISDPEALRGLRPHVVLECVGGTADTFAVGADIAGPMAEVSVVGLFDTPQMIDTNRAFRNETRFSFPVAYAAVDGVHDYDVAARILAEEQTALAPLISHRVPLDEITTGFRIAGDKRSGALRIVVQPEHS